MNCNVCYEHLFINDNKIMDIETAKKATKVFYNNRDKNYDRHYIMFFGGEPLLNFDLIPQYLDWFRNNYPNFKCNFHIFTNGLLLDKSKVDFFLDNNITIFLSYDINLPCYNINKSATEAQYTQIKKILLYSLKQNPDLVIPYYIIHNNQIDELEVFLSQTKEIGAKKVAITREFFTKWGRTEIEKVIDITKSFKANNNIAILVFPEIESNCNSCKTNNIMVYPNGDIYDLCVVSAGSLIKLNLASNSIMKNFYFGSIYSCKTLKLNIREKRLSLRIDPNSVICTHCPTINDSNFVMYLSKLQ